MKEKKSTEAIIKDFEKTAADLEKLNQIMIKANAEKMKKWEKVIK